MRTLARSLAVVGLCLADTSCVTYSGVTRSPDGQLYISGGTNYFVYTAPWIRRCDVDGVKLNCEELTESPPPKNGAASDDSATSAPAAEPAQETSAPEEAPVPPPRAKRK